MLEQVQSGPACLQGRARSRAGRGGRGEGRRGGRAVAKPAPPETFPVAVARRSTRRAAGGTGRRRRRRLLAARAAPALPVSRGPVSGPPSHARRRAGPRPPPPPPGPPPAAPLGPPRVSAVRSGAHRVRAAAGIGGALLSPGLETRSASAAGLQCGSRGGARTARSACTRVYMRARVCLCVSTPAETHLLPGLTLSRAGFLSLAVQRGRLGNAGTSCEVRWGCRRGEPRGSNQACIEHLDVAGALPRVDLISSSPQTYKEVDLFPFVGRANGGSQVHVNMIAAKLVFEPRFPAAL